MPSRHRIKALRLALGLTQAQLAARLAPLLKHTYLDDGDISRIETGRRSVKLDEAPAFAKALECRLEDLVEPLDGV